MDTGGCWGSAVWGSLAGLSLSVCGAANPGVCWGCWGIRAVFGWAGLASGSLSCPLILLPFNPYREMEGSPE